MVINLQNYMLGVFQVASHSMRCAHGSINIGMGCWTYLCCPEAMGPWWTKLQLYHKNRRISTMECTLIFGFGSYPPRFTYEIPSKFHQNSIQDSLQFSFHMPQNSTHSSPSDTRCQNQNQSSPFDTRCQMILILTLTLDLAHRLHC